MLVNAAGSKGAQPVCAVAIVPPDVGLVHDDSEAWLFGLSVPVAA